MPNGSGVHPSPVSQPMPAGHVAGVAHAFMPHVTSQLHDEPQVTPPSQLPFPLHVTSQDPEPHVTPCWHVLTPLHAMSQLAAWEQSTRRQSSLLPHTTLQAIPAGHVIIELRHRLPEQSIVQSA